MFLRHSFKRLKQGLPLNLLLINMGLLDELISGVLFIGLPLLRGQLGLTYEQIGLIFSVAALSGIVLEPPLYLLSDRGSKHRWILGGLFGMSCAFILAGGANSFILLVVAFALTSPAGAMAIGLSQAALIDNAPDEGTRIMTRWTMLSSIGDFLSPLAVTTIVSFGLGWRGLCWIAAGCWLAAALGVWLKRFPQHRLSYSLKEDESTMSIRAALKLALHDTILLRWVILSMLTTMLDEIFLTFLVLYLRDVLRASPFVSGLTVGIGIVGGFLGLFLLDRLPGRSGMMRFISSLGQPFEIVLPAIVGLVAGQFGLLESLVVLGSAPVFFLLLAPRNKKGL